MRDEAGVDTPVGKFVEHMREFKVESPHPPRNVLIDTELEDLKSWLRYKEAVNRNEALRQAGVPEAELTPLPKITGRAAWDVHYRDWVHNDVRHLVLVEDSVFYQEPLGPRLKVLEARDWPAVFQRWTDHYLSTPEHSLSNIKDAADAIFDLVFQDQEVWGINKTYVKAYLHIRRDGTVPLSLKPWKNPKKQKHGDGPQDDDEVRAQEPASTTRGDHLQASKDSKPSLPAMASLTPQDLMGDSRFVKGQKNIAATRKRSRVYGDVAQASKMEVTASGNPPSFILHSRMLDAFSWVVYLLLNQPNTDEIVNMLMRRFHWTGEQFSAPVDVLALSKALALLPRENTTKDAQTRRPESAAQFGGPLFSNAPTLSLQNLNIHQLEGGASLLHDGAKAPGLPSSASISQDALLGAAGTAPSSGPPAGTDFFAGQNLTNPVLETSHTWINTPGSPDFWSDLLEKAVNGDLHADGSFEDLCNKHAPLTDSEAEQDGCLWLHIRNTSMQRIAAHIKSLIQASPMVKFQADGYAWTFSKDDTGRAVVTRSELQPGLEIDCVTLSEDGCNLELVGKGLVYLGADGEPHTAKLRVDYDDGTVGVLPVLSSFAGNPHEQAPDQLEVTELPVMDRGGCQITVLRPDLQPQSCYILDGSIPFLQKELAALSEAPGTPVAARASTPLALETGKSSSDDSAWSGGLCSAYSSPALASVAAQKTPHLAGASDATALHDPKATPEARQEGSNSMVDSGANDAELGKTELSPTELPPTVRTPKGQAADDESMKRQEAAAAAAEARLARQEADLQELDQKVQGQLVQMGEQERRITQMEETRNAGTALDERARRLSAERPPQQLAREQQATRYSVPGPANQQSGSGGMTELTLPGDKDLDEWALRCAKWLVNCGTGFAIFIVVGKWKSAIRNAFMMHSDSATSVFDPRYARAKLAFATMYVIWLFGTLALVVLEWVAAATTIWPIYEQPLAALFSPLLCAAWLVTLISAWGAMSAFILLSVLTKLFCTADAMPAVAAARYIPAGCVELERFAKRSMTVSMLLLWFLFVRGMPTAWLRFVACFIFVVGMEVTSTFLYYLGIAWEEIVVAKGDAFWQRVAATFTGRQLN